MRVARAIAAFHRPKGRSLKGGRARRCDSAAPLDASPRAALDAKHSHYAQATGPTPERRAGALATLLRLSMGGELRPAPRVGDHLDAPLGRPLTADDLIATASEIMSRNLPDRPRGRQNHAPVAASDEQAAPR